MTIRPFFLFSAASVALIWACSSEETTKTEEAPENAPPVADAGSDRQYSTDQPVMLDGGASFDPDGDPLTYIWSFGHLPEGSSLTETSFSLNNSGASNTSFLPDMSGVYIVQLQVQDAAGEYSAIDSTTVKVDPGQSPVAVAGEDVWTSENQQITLNGSASYDPMERSLSYSWSLSSVPAGSALTAVDSPTSAETTMTVDAAGLYLVALTVNNGIVDSPSDIVQVRVTSSDPQAPVADAGGDISDAEDCEDTQLSGEGSFDPNGSNLSYFWALQSKPTGSSASNDSFSDREMENPTFFADVAGEYRISLAVNDGDEWSAPNMISLTAAERVGNAPPTVNAGNAITIDAGDASCQESGYEFICDDCEAVTVNLGVGASVADPDGDVFTYSWSAVEGDASFADTTSLTTMVVLDGAQPEEPNACASTEFILELSAIDCPGEQSMDIMTITVNCCGVEEAAASQ